MSDEREMTLQEWCAKLPDCHLVNRELRELETEVARLKVIVDDLELKDPGLVGFKRTWKARAKAAESTLRAVAELTEKWRLLKHDEQCHSLMPIAQICEGCADELEALLKEEWQ